MILVINVCKEKLHYNEFVKPIEDILQNSGIKFVIKHYNQLDNSIINSADKIIICGTSLKDNQFIQDIEQFEWIKNYSGKVLGICAGMQILGLLFGGKIKKKTELGFYQENFIRNFLGLSGKQEVYHLHNYYIFGNFENFVNSSISQAIKIKGKEFYGILFHPEVRQQSLINKFALLKT